MSLDRRFFGIVPHTTQALADAIGASVRGNAQVAVTGAAPVAEANSGELTFLNDNIGGDGVQAGGYPDADAIIITTAAVADNMPENGTYLIVDVPRLRFAKAIALLVPDTSPGIVAPAADRLCDFADVSVGPGVMCGVGVKIGAGSRIEAGAVIHRGVSIGRNCQIGANVVLSNAIVGDDVVIQPNAVIGSAGFGFEITTEGPVALPHVGSVVIGDGVLIGAGSCIDRGTLGPTLIGDRAMLDNLVHIAHNCVIGSHAILTAQVGLAGGAIIGEGAMLGGQAGVGPATRVGKGAIVMAQSGVTKDVEDEVTVAGFPASDARKMWQERALLRRLLAQSGRKED
ncbi:MAG: UDP-3-O-(3-hydroxymyristoyl)glucosamine N-acyltransferase [Rhodospirillaceae bacterium]|nr:UDP-3-O-(3-hydroxymyristoyl)glucosamine N-acyltransferase [Rhodospirillaceae bacterium]